MCAIMCVCVRCAPRRQLDIVGTHQLFSVFAPSVRAWIEVGHFVYESSYQPQKPSRHQKPRARIVFMWCVCVCVCDNDNILSLTREWMHFPYHHFEPHHIVGVLLVCVCVWCWMCWWNSTSACVLRINRSLAQQRSTVPASDVWFVYVYTDNNKRNAQKKLYTISSHLPRLMCRSM